MTGIKKVHEFGGDILCGVTYSAMAKYSAPATKENWENSVSTLKEVGQVAQDLGVRIGLEVVNRYESNLLNTATQVGQSTSLLTICFWRVENVQSWQYEL